MAVDKRRQRGQRNRSALLDAALELFGTDGYDSTTVEQIAALAGVAPRTFFHHFPSKEDVLFDGYAERLDEVAGRFQASESRSLWSAMSEVSSAVARSIAEHPRRYLERSRLYAQVPTLRARMLRINEEWIDRMTTAVALRLDADPRADIRPRLAATVVNGANRAAIELWVASGGHADLEQLIATGIELLRPTLDRLERPVGAAQDARAS